MSDPQAVMTSTGTGHAFGRQNTGKTDDSGEGVGAFRGGPVSKESSNSGSLLKSEDPSAVYEGKAGAVVEKTLAERMTAAIIREISQEKASSHLSIKQEEAVNMLGEFSSYLKSKDEDSAKFLLTKLVRSSVSIKDGVIEGKDVTDKNGNRLIHFIARHGGETIWNTLFGLDKSCQSFINSGNGGGYTPLHQVALFNNIEMAGVFVKLDAMLDPTLKYMKQTPLHLAAEAGSTDVVRFLLESRADHSLKDKDGNTALHLAAGKKSEKAVQALLEFGADKSLKNEQGNTALHVATDKKSLEIAIPLLAQRGTEKQEVNMQNKLGKTSLHLAVERHSKNIIPILLKSGADKSLKDNEGNTAYNTALKYRYSDKALV
nr:ankyrin repeat domain-containing protein [Endozoicomonas sp.]